MGLEYSQQIFEKHSNIKFHENLPSGIQVVPCRWLDRWTDMMKLIIAFCNFLNAPKNLSMHPYGGQPHHPHAEIMI
jgi:hypothetical protein